MTLRSNGSSGRAATLAVAGLFLAVSSGCGRPPAAEFVPPNIFLVSLDTVRRDAVAAHGAENALALAGFARDAVVFDNAYTTIPFTLPAHMSMFTGLHHVEHGVEGRKDVLGPSTGTVAEELRQKGYATAGIYTSDWLKPEFGFDRGFESYETIPHRATYADRAIRRTFEIVDGRADDDRPLFLFLHLYDAHSDFVKQSGTNLPYYSPEAYRQDLAETVEDRFCDREGNCATSYLLAADKERREVSSAETELIHDLYRRGCRHLDHDLEALFAGLRERGLYEGAVIILTSDHGEEFREHGKFIHSQVYEESVAVPLLVKLPKHENAGEHIGSLVTLMDIHTMVLAMAGGDQSPTDPRRKSDTGGFGFDGRDSVLFQDKLWKPAWGLRTGNWKLVRDRQSGMTALFQPSSDSAELHDVSDRHPDVVHRLTVMMDERIKALRQHAAILATTPTTAANSLNAEEEERLKALGYLD